MFLYHGNKITTAAVGARIMGVRCDKCGREYYFELTRIGTGSSVAHYGLGQESATADSRTKSQADVAHRLAEEAELVPCPHSPLMLQVSLDKGERIMRRASLFLFLLGS